MKSALVRWWVTGLMAGFSWMVGCSSGAPPAGSTEKTGSVRFHLASFEWQDIQDRKAFQFVNYSLVGPNFTAKGSFNSAEKNRIEGAISGVPVGPGYRLTLSATSIDGTWSCSGTSRPFRESCSDNNEDDELRIRLTCLHKWVKSWHRAPVIVEINVECQTSDGGVDSGSDGCVPKSPAQACANSNCGSAPDGCGATITCGVCTAPVTCTIPSCTPGATAGTCGCTPLTVAAACGSNTCGTASDGCGCPLSCGTCTAPNTCHLVEGGTAGTCSCTPMTFAQACGSFTCGSAPDGCGGSINCGTAMTPSGCPSGTTCSIADGGTLGNCTSCTPKTAAQACGTSNCGSAPDGCGGSINCGTCAPPGTCSGAGGGPGSCGCVPIPQAQACGTNNCGTAFDGCGGVVTCGTCPAGVTCSAHGGPGTCGCPPLTMQQACGTNNCGSALDNCGGTYNCGTCNTPQQLCSIEAGSARVCVACVPRSMQTACGTHNCGTGPDGCGGSIPCGTCTAPQVCSHNSDTVGDCCTPMSAQASCGSNNCGVTSDGCGGSVDCGTCPAGQMCNAYGVGNPGQCFTPCTPTTCGQQGARCGTIPDGCGSTLNCGSCGAGQICSSGACVACTPNCTGKVCGDDGCGGTCGTCPAGQGCTSSGTCAQGCQLFNNGAGCTPTEQRFVDKSVECYRCLVNVGCLNDVTFTDTGHECSDVSGNAIRGAQAGAARSDLCLGTIDCILGSSCASNDVSLCYCGTLGAGDTCTTSANPAAANGPCASTELASLEHPPTDPPSAVVPDSFNQNLGGGKANQIFSCARVSGCQMCLQ